MIGSVPQPGLLPSIVMSYSEKFSVAFLLAAVLLTAFSRQRKDVAHRDFPDSILFLHVEFSGHVLRISISPLNADPGVNDYLGRALRSCLDIMQFFPATCGPATARGKPVKEGFPGLFSRSGCSQVQFFVLSVTPEVENFLKSRARLALYVRVEQDRFLSR
jgi:hypothetical protein